jgi:putative transposase
MRTLNLRKVRWIVREMNKREFSVYYIAKQQGVTMQYVRRLYQKYKDVQPYKLNSTICLRMCGRKPKPFTNQEVNAVLEVKKEYGFGATITEKILAEKGIKVPHNRIHRIFLHYNLAKDEPKKKKRRKYVRYERKHSNSLWHTDWTWHNNKWYIFYEDDASRLIVSYGEFDAATTVNSITVFDRGTEKWGFPKQLLTDRGTQFCAKEENVYAFREHVTSKGVKHILSRVNHPQTNGKLEKLNDTMQKLIDRFGNLDDAVKFYNERRPHMSLENGHLRTPLQAFYEKKYRRNA